MYVKREDCWECDESDVKRCEQVRYGPAVFPLFMDQSSTSDHNYILYVQGHECFSNHWDDGNRGCYSASRFVQSVKVATLFNFLFSNLIFKNIFCLL